MGMGHMRRNLLIAQAFSAMPDEPIVLLVAGAREAGAVTLPAGVDTVTLPAIRKNGDGTYRAHCRHLSLDDVIGLRSTIIESAMRAFEPDVLVVDNVPRGAVRELDRTLALLRERPTVRVVLGLRDVLDDPVTVRREWMAADNFETIREHYDAIWVYGDRHVYDTVREYALPPDIARLARYAGYFDQRDRPENDTYIGAERVSELAHDATRPLNLCLVGGGEDGDRVAHAFTLAAMSSSSNDRFVLVTGPYMSAETRATLEERAGGGDRLVVLPFVPEPAPLVAAASRVIAMGGYNTVCEILSYRKRALIVPRVRPRQEQLIRAKRMSALGLLDMLRPEDVSAETITQWLVEKPAAEREPMWPAMTALDSLPGLLREVRTTRRHRPGSRPAQPITRPRAEEGTSASF